MWHPKQTVILSPQHMNADSAQQCYVFLANLQPYLTAVEHALTKYVVAHSLQGKSGNTNRSFLPKILRSGSTKRGATQVGTSQPLITDPSKSKLGKKTERRVTFAVRVCTATVETGFEENLYNAIIFVQDFSPVSTPSGV
jgi:hypothetical protein